MVFDEHDGIRLLDEVLAFLGDFQDTIVLDVLDEQFVDQGLTDDGSPELFVVFVACTEEFVVFLLCGFDVARQLTSQQLSDVLGLEELLSVIDGFDDEFESSLPSNFSLGERQLSHEPQFSLLYSSPK